MQEIQNFDTLETLSLTPLKSSKHSSSIVTSENLLTGISNATAVSEKINLNSEDISYLWIPCDETCNMLRNINSILTEPDYIVPSVVFKKLNNMNLESLLKKYFPEENVDELFSTKSVVISDSSFRRAISCTKNCQLMDVLQATADFLTKYHEQQNLSTSFDEALKVWCVRLKLLIKLQFFDESFREMNNFNNFDAPNAYREIFTKSSCNLAYSIIPFDLRFLHADLPRLLGKPEESLVRLQKLADIVRKILQMIPLFSLDYEGMISNNNLWHHRLLQIHVSLASCVFMLKDFKLTFKICEEILQNLDRPFILEMSHVNLLSIMGRLALQLGDVKLAENFFDKIQILNYKSVDGAQDAQFLSMLETNEAYVQIFRGNYFEASTKLKNVLKIKPCVSVTNNLAICLLYLGNLREAIDILEDFLRLNTATALNDKQFCTNLSTLYELLSSSTATKKKCDILKLLTTVSSLSSSTDFEPQNFDVACLKIS